MAELQETMKIMNRRKGSFQICLMGAPLDTGNRGVSVLGTSLIKIMSTLRPAAPLSLFVGNRSNKPQTLTLSNQPVTVATVNYRLSPRATHGEHLLWLLARVVLSRLLPTQKLREGIIKRNDRLRALSEVDFVGDIHGGDSFSDIYGVGSFVMGTLPNIIILLLNKRLFLLPQTYGPYRTKLTRMFARHILSRATCILSRDRQGLEVVREILGVKATGKDIRFCPDVGFVMDYHLPENPDIVPPVGTGTSRPLIGFNISGLLYNGGYTGQNMFGLEFDYKMFVERLIEQIMNNTDAHLLLVPHAFGPAGSVNNDLDASQVVFDRLAESFADRVHLVRREYDHFELKGIIGLCDFFIGSRMHACIGALSQTIPTVGVAYSQKFKGVFASIGADDQVIDARQVGLEEAIGRILALYSRRVEAREEIGRLVDSLKAEIIGTFEELLGHHLPEPQM